MVTAVVLAPDADPEDFCLRLSLAAPLSPSPLSRFVGAMSALCPILTREN